MKITNISPATMKRQIPAFKDWLREHGCEIQEPSNEFELARFNSAVGVGVVYLGGKGLSVNVPFVADALKLFLTPRAEW